MVGLVRLMILYIIGINHFDPSCRLKLCNWFREWAEKGLKKPCFVATEWGQRIFERVREQRPELRQLLKKQWPHASENLLDTLSLSLAYEGDAHTTHFPEVEVLWLDDGREVNDDDVDNYARDRFEMYKRFLNSVPESTDEDSILRRIREAAVQEAGPIPQEGNARDEQFATRILQRIENSQCGQATVVVGKNHAGDFKGSMRRLLQEKGCSCEILLL